MAEFDSESKFEEALIKLLYTDKGWEPEVLRYPTEERLIQNWADILYANNRSIDRLGNYPLTQGEMAQIIDQINDLRTPLRLNEFINGKTISIRRDNEEDKQNFGREVNLKIYDRMEIAQGQSRYQIAEQPLFKTPHPLASDRRGDFILLINGMPLIHVELKKSGIPISQAYGQIEKYSNMGIFQRGIFSLVQIFVAMNPEEMVYFANPGFDGNFNPKFYFHWADVNNEPINHWKQVAEHFLSIPMAHQMIGFYTVADKTDNVLKVMRSYQFYAARAISDRVAKCHWDEKEIYGGYVWHTTGSGKTLTSFKSAQLIADSNDADKVVFLMDRIELGTQSFGEYQGFTNPKLEIYDTEDTDALVSLLKDDQSKLIVTSIQKMSRIKQDGTNDRDISKINKKRIVIIIDEAHRSVFGDMLIAIRATFKHAIYFGFTGTPIHEDNPAKKQATSFIFGDEIHRYSIADGIRDKNVLGFDPYMVQTFKERDLRKIVALEKTHSQNEEEALSNPKKAKVYQKYMDEIPMAGSWDNLGNYSSGIEDEFTPSLYENEEHHRAVVSDIKEVWLQHSLNKKYHALFATSSIPEAIEYYRLLHEEIPDMKATCLFDPSIDNTGGAIIKQDAILQILTDYNNRFNKTYKMSQYNKFKKDVATRMAHKEPYLNLPAEKQLDMLIVVDQMLTGFDSKWVNTLYLDKVRQDENLIQAFSRTNRVFGDDKKFGVIRYYRKPWTMERNVKKAIREYSGNRPFGIFAFKLKENLEEVNRLYTRIKELFENNGVSNFEQLPEASEVKAMFAKDFHSLHGYLESARIQGFVWKKLEWDFDGETMTVLLDEETYNILLQRYKELYEGTGGGGGGDDAPYDIDTHITQLATGKINTDYMNSRFVKFVKALQINDLSSPIVKETLDELHKSFAALSQEEQKYANIFLGDFQRGTVQLEEGKTLRDYVTEYQKRAKDDQIHRFAEALGIDEEQLRDFMQLTITESDINAFGRFDRLVDSVDRAKAKAYFEQEEGHTIPARRVPMKIAEILRRFVLNGGFEISSPTDHTILPYSEDEPEIIQAAEGIYIYGSIPVDLPNTKREDLVGEKLELILMYAIGQPNARKKTESAGKIALGIKENMLKNEQLSAYKSLKYLLFHYWSNPKAYQLTKEPLLVELDNVPSGYLKRMEKDAVKYLLLEYDPESPSNIGNIDVLRTQRKGEIRYLPFVTTIESITKITKDE